MKITFTLTDRQRLRGMIAFVVIVALGVIGSLVLHFLGK